MFSPSNLNPLRDYQLKGVSFLKSNFKAGLFDDCGLGKCAMSLTAAGEVGAKRVLILSPAVARFNWKREIEKFYPGTPSVLVVTSRLTAAPSEDIVIISHDLLVNKDTLKLLLSEAWDLIIVDEAHFFKNKDAKRTKALYGAKMDASKNSLVAKAKRVWLLTGTPSPNHTGELYPHLRGLFPQTIMGAAGKPMGYQEYVSRYCKTIDTDWGVSIVGSQNVKELRSRINGIFIRRLKKEVLPELPDLDVVTVPLSVDQADIKNIEQTLSQAYNTRELAEAAKTMSPDDLIKFLKQNAAANATYRRHTGLLKLPICLEYLKTELASGIQKVIVFAIHHEVIDRTIEHLQAFNPVKIDGRDNAKEKDAAEQRFMNDRNCQVFVGQITASGTALTLTAASDVYFFESDWVPDNNYQALSRAHRFTQTRGVVARFLTLPDTIDDAIQRAVARKTRELQELFG
jgi:SWI/SNF-related matrix-associated actin-dependent regulator of chromatin subfamily A-like protein 1